MPIWPRLLCKWVYGAEYHSLRPEGHPVRALSRLWGLLGGQTGSFEVQTVIASDWWGNLLLMQVKIIMICLCLFMWLNWEMFQSEGINRTAHSHPVPSLSYLPSKACLPIQTVKSHIPKFNYNGVKYKSTFPNCMIAQLMDQNIHCTSKTNYVGLSCADWNVGGFCWAFI